MEAPATIQGGAAGAAPGETNSGRVASVHAAVTAKHAEKRGRGRPPKNQSVPRTAPALAQRTPVEDGSPPFAPGVVEKAVKALCSSVDRLLRRRTYTTGLLITRNRELAEEFSKEVAMTEEETQQIATLSESVCLQYQILGHHAPALFLLVIVSGYGTKVFLTLNKLDELAKLNAAKPHVPDTPPEKGPSVPA